MDVTEYLKKRHKEVMSVLYYDIPPRGWGLPPQRLILIDEGMARAKTGQESWEAWSGKTVPFTDFIDPRHPEVQIVPTDRPINVVDAWGDMLGPEQHCLPFSKTSFVIMPDQQGVFEEAECAGFWRLWMIKQLQFLTLPFLNYKDRVSTMPLPVFNHQRITHCLIAAAMAEVILGRNGFSATDRAPIVLTVLAHDIALPAGGDSVKRISPYALDEEENFAWALKHWQLADRWQEKFGFDLKLASDWVKNRGLFGQLLDICDKLSYTALDCHELGGLFNGEMRKFGLACPLFMDVWEDIVFSDDHQRLAFTNPERLFLFVLARTLEHAELLRNPASRTLDFFHSQLVKPAYEKGLITWQELLTWNDEDLEHALKAIYPEQKVVLPWLVSDDEWAWIKFSAQTELNQFVRARSVKFDHTESITRFNSGLDWPIWQDGKIIALRDCLHPNQIKEIADLVNSFIGYYAYWRVRLSKW
ncbi:MAG: HD domain-containing protein [Candidatus Komeilibacteria bacterium]|nr:HD domain-containing protein [Candidatus Komeilibacteria bacterium]